MKITSILVPALLLMMLACHDGGELLVDAGHMLDSSADAQVEPGAWEPAACARSHDVVTLYRNTSDQPTLRVTNTHYFHDLAGEPTATLVRTCYDPPTTEWGCPINYATRQSCTGDEAGPWPLCTVDFAGTDGAGAALASCGVRITKEVIDGPSGQVTQTTVIENPTVVFTRAAQ